MLALARQYAPSVADAEDALQDAFVKIFQRLDDYQGSGSFAGWVRRIVVSTAIDAWHKRRVRRVDFDLDDVRHLPAPDATAIEQLTLAEVRNLIDQLPTGCRLVLLLYTVEGYSHAEIGQRLGIGEGASAAQLTRARQRLTALIRAASHVRQPAPHPPASSLPATETTAAPFHPLTMLLFQ